MEIMDYERQPYVAGSQPAGENIIKLNTNVMLMDQVQNHQALASSLMPISYERLTLGAALRQAFKLRNTSAQADQVIIGNGSDDILSMAFLAF